MANWTVEKYQRVRSSLNDGVLRPLRVLAMTLGLKPNIVEAVAKILHLL